MPAVSSDVAFSSYVATVHTHMKRRTVKMVTLITKLTVIISELMIYTRVFNFRSSPLCHLDDLVGELVAERLLHALVVHRVRLEQAAHDVLDAVDVRVGAPDRVRDAGELDGEGEERKENLSQACFEIYKLISV